LFALTASSALAIPRLWADKTLTTALRDVTTEPSKGQPDSLEFNNNGNVTLVTSIGTVTCTELEFGSSVLNNNGTTAPALAIPWGVAEADNCSAPGLANIQTLFDTLTTGVVGEAGTTASVTITGTKVLGFTGTLHNLKFSQKLVAAWCTGSLGGLTGKINNSEGPFVEESPPNLNIQFTEIKVPITKTGGTGECPTEGKLTGNFFLETPSTATDTAWVEG
jgi:hypothetical protein